MSRHLILACAIAFGSFGLAAAQSSTSVHPTAAPVYDSMHATAAVPSIGRLAERVSVPSGDVITAAGPAVALPMPR
jgi:hypothetical protein